MFRAVSTVSCLFGLGLVALPAAVAIEYVDDFQTASTYDSAALLAPCYGGQPTKYSFIEAISADIFNEWAVSGGGEFRIFNSATTSATGLAVGVEGRLELGVVGWLGAGIGCPGEPPALQSNLQFTNDDVCIYGGYTFNRFQLSHAKFSGSDNRGKEFGPDKKPGFAGIDDDGDGTTDDSGGYGFQSSEYLWPGMDGRPGDAGVDDDGLNGTDDQGEHGWPETDDSDDTIGEWGFMIGVNTNLLASKMIWLDIDPMNIPNQFSIREFWLAAGGLTPGGANNDEISSKFYNPFTNYNYVFCTSGTCYGAMMWVERDMANPRETLGPWLNSNHEGAPDECVLGVFNNKNGAYALVQNATFQGSGNFSEAFWIVEGDPATHYPSPSADLDHDKDVDVNDFLTFSGCFAGSLVPPAPGCQNAQADLDDDGDVDVNDFLTFSTCFNGSLNNPSPACLPPVLANCAS